MTRLCRFATATLALLCACMAATGQVVLLGGGVSTIADTEGAGLSLYEPDTTTQASVGVVHGIHLGASREVRSGPVSLTAGDSILSLALPTDLAEEYRSLVVRGALLQTKLSPERVTNALQPGHIGVSGRAFIGWTGNGYQNAFFNSVQASKAVQLAELHVALNRQFEVSAIASRGTERSLLASAAWAPRRSFTTAATVGWSGGHPVFRAMASGRGSTWQGGINITAGTLHLQPEPSLTSFTLERTGLNGSISKRVGSWLFVDAARYQFDTSSVVDGAQNGVTASRSTFYEAGATVRKGPAETGLRLLKSNSGSQTSSGTVAIAGWNQPRWSVRATAIRSVSQTLGVDRSAEIDTTQKVSQHLRLTEGTTLGNGAPTINAGGAYENRFGMVSVSHRETYVPFGNNAGFHRLLAIGIHLHLGNTELAANQISGGGLKSAYDVAVNGFYGDSLGDSVASSVSVRPRMPKYAIHGRVTNEAGEAIRGAAVNAGAETVYTDSEGQFQAQFTRVVPVRVALAPGEFLASTRYRAVSRPVVVRPDLAGEGQPVLLRAEQCMDCGEPEMLDQDNAAMPTELPPQRPIDTLHRVATTLLHLGLRMMHLLPRRSGH